MSNLSTGLKSETTFDFNQDITSRSISDQLGHIADSRGKNSSTTLRELKSGFI
jgi:hypothetical protein